MLSKIERWSHTSSNRCRSFRSQHDGNYRLVVNKAFVKEDCPDSLFVSLLSLMVNNNKNNNDSQHLFTVYCVPGTVF